MDEKNKESKESKMTVTNEGAGTSAQAVAAALDAADNIANDEPKPPDDAICLFCKRRAENKLKKIDAKHDIVSGLTLLTIEYEELPSMTDYICFQCIYRINIIVDFRRLLERNLKKSRANYYYNIGDKEKCRKYLLSSSNCRIETKPFKLTTSKSENYATTANGNGNDVHVPKFRISNVRSCAPPTNTNFPSTNYESVAQQQDFLFDCFLHVQNLVNNDTERASSPILEIMYEDRPQSVLVTESGGADTATTTQAFYECDNCSKTFTRSRFLRKHQRQQHLKNNNNTNKDNENNNDKQTTNRSKRRQRKQKRRKSQEKKQQQNELEPQQQQKQRAKIIYNCRHCNNTFPGITSLKQHLKTAHRKVLECKHCAEKFFNTTDWELHQAICYGKMLAKGQVNCNGYRTRSRSLPTIIARDAAGVKCRPNYNEQSDNDSDEEIDENHTLYSEKVRNIDEWVTDQLERRKDDDASSLATSFTRLSSIMTDDDDEEDDDGDGDFSKDVDNDASTTSTKRTHNSKKRIKIRAKDSVRGRTKKRKNSDEKPIRVLGNPPEFGYPDVIVPPYLRLPIKKQIFHCPEIDCPHTETCLNRLMDHDIECHGQLPLFYCKICKKRYVRRFYYDQHLMYQCYGWYFCIKCEQKFDYEFQLRDHLNLHRTLSYKCETCSLSFLSQRELENHKFSKKHELQLKLKLHSSYVFERYNYNFDRKDLSILNYKPSLTNVDNQNVNSAMRSNNSSNIENLPYRSEIKILKLMELEPLNEREILRWYRGIVFELQPGGRQNCAIPSKLPNQLPSSTSF